MEHVFPKVETVFSVNGVKQAFTGSGQVASRAAIKSVPGYNFIKLEGFNVDGKFIRATLKSV